MTACREGAISQGLNLDSDDELHKWFTSEIVKNLHVIFTMNPPSGDLASQAAASPALFNRCVLNWIGDWSPVAMYQAAALLTEKLNIDISSYQSPETFQPLLDSKNRTASFREVAVCTMVRIHLTASKMRINLASEENAAVMSPSDFLAFIDHFVKIHSEKKEELEDQQRHFNVGLDK
jgi:dynein heavy chain 1